MRAVLICILCALATAAVAQSPASLPPQHIVEVHGIHIHYYDIGEKTSPVVLLLHGMGDKAANHMGTAAALATSFRVIVPDQVGHGASDKPAITYRVRTFSDFNKGLLDALNIKDAYVMGESLGGWVAADMALRFPETFHRVVLVDSGGVKVEGRPFSATDIPDDMYLSSIFDERKFLERLFFHKERVTDPMVEGVFREFLQSGTAPVIANFLAGVEHGNEWLNDRAAGIKVPTLIVWCKHDELLSVAGADVLQQKITGSKKVLLDDCGHIPDENWQTYHEALLSFLVAK